MLQFSFVQCIYLCFYLYVPICFIYFSSVTFHNNNNSHVLINCYTHIVFFYIFNRTIIFSTPWSLSPSHDDSVRVTSHFAIIVSFSRDFLFHVCHYRQWSWLDWISLRNKITPYGVSYILSLTYVFFLILYCLPPTSDNFIFWYREISKISNHTNNIEINMMI